ncbi:helix-turn-helix transcriptional regulator [Candidatus Woesearchaeota archaeon]|nr:helix-turn-helix transcriptional regulator [Candidatus Woesearchaeota archaeon]
MEITPKIVKIQVSSIKRKLNIGSRTSLAVYALREGLAKLPEPDHETEHSIDDLTEREREIFQLVIVGKSNEEINADLSISQRTVRRHIEHIMKKLEVHRRIGLLSFASHEPLEANQIT